MQNGQVNATLVNNGILSLKKSFKKLIKKIGKVNLPKSQDSQELANP